MSLERYQILNACLALPEFTSEDVHRYCGTSLANIKRFISRHPEWFADLGSVPSGGKGRPKRRRALSELGLAVAREELASLSAVADTVGSPKAPAIFEVIDAQLVELEDTYTTDDARSVLIDDLAEDLAAATIMVGDLKSRFGASSVSTIDDQLGVFRERYEQALVPDVIERVADGDIVDPNAGDEPKWFAILTQLGRDTLNAYLNEWNAKCETFVHQFGHWLEAPKTAQRHSVAFIVDGFDEGDDVTPEVERFFTRRQHPAACFRLDAINDQHRHDFFYRLMELTDDPRAVHARARVIITATAQHREWSSLYRDLSRSKSARWDKHTRELERCLSAVLNRTPGSEGMDVRDYIELARPAMASSIQVSPANINTQTNMAIYKQLFSELGPDAALCLERDFLRNTQKAQRDEESSILRVRMDEPRREVPQLLARFVA